jgi:hypothetical protein
MSVDLFSFAGVAASLSRSTGTTPEPLRYKALKTKPAALNPGLFEPYRIGRIDIKGARVHPTALVEPTALASVKAPMPKYAPVLEPVLVANGTLSDVQLESVIYAGEAHRRFFTYEWAREIVETEIKISLGKELEIEKRRQIVEEVSARYGFFIPAGTGVGKGRIACGIIADNFNQGRTRAVYITASDILINDLERDWQDLGRPTSDIVRWKKSEKGSIDVGDRDSFILAGTYTMLQHRTKKGKKRGDTRVDDLVKFLGEDFDGVLALDESHNAQNAAPERTKSGDAAASSQQGAAVLELQHRLPNARVIYISATGFSRIDAFAYAVRLGLWGRSTTFKNQSEFIKAMDQGGTAALETVARDLKARGLMFAPQLSFEGVTYERVEHTLDQLQVDRYNEYVRAWQLIHGGIDRELLALNAVDADPDGSLTPIHVEGSPFKKLHAMTSHAEQLFLSQAIHSLQMPTIIEIMRQKLALGEAVVCQMTHTGETALKEALAREGADADLSEIDTTHRTALIDFVMKHYPIHEYAREYSSEKKCMVAVVKRKVPSMEPIVSPDALVRRGEMIDAIREVVFPLPILDQLHKAFPGQVAEVSGRSKWLEPYIDGDGNVATRVGKRTAKSNEKAIKDFADDRKRILAFTEGAGGAGLSFHASRKIVNQRKRNHIFCEMSWSADKAIQGMGRTHRTDQSVAPRYIFVSISNLPGQKRLTSTPARKIADLGALTRGHRECADNAAFRAEDNLETVWAERAIRILTGDVAAGRVPGLDRATFEREMRMSLRRLEVIPSNETWLKTLKYGVNRMTCARFLNRLMSASIGLDGGIQQRIMDAFYTRLENVIEEAIENGLYDTGIEVVQAESIVKVGSEQLMVDDFGATTDLVELAITDTPQDSVRFGIARQTKIDYERRTGKKDAHFVDMDGRVELHVPYDSAPEGGATYLNVYAPNGVRDARPSGARVITETEAEPAWNAMYDALPRVTRTRYLAVGMLTPVWAKLPASTEVYRLQTDEGEPLLGRVLHPSFLDDVRSAFAPEVAPPTPIAA